MNRLLIAFFLFSPPAMAKGAFAFSLNPDGKWVVFADFNRGTKITAEDNAMTGCKAKGGLKCKILISVENGCHAVAITNEGQTGLGTGPNQRVAQARSVASCLAVDPGGSCVVRKSFCDNTGGFVQSDANPQPITGGGSTPFFCRSPGDYNRCMSTSQGPASEGGPAERERYCRMAFC